MMKGIGMGIKIESKISVAQLINKIRFLTLITGNDEEAYLRAQGVFSTLLVKCDYRS